MASTTTVSDSGIDMSVDSPKQIISHTDTDKEVAVPITDTDKQTYDRTADSSKEVHRSPLDTEKIFVPNLPPTSSQKEVAFPSNNTDKELLLADSNESTTPPSPASAPISIFRLEKSNPLGLVLPQNQKLLLRSLHPIDKTDQGAAFVTDEMDWLDIMSVNPPPFELYTAHDFKQTELVARFLPRGWQGLVGMTSEFEVSAQGDRQKWEVLRKGIMRTYRLRGLLGQKGREYVWKGSSKTAKAMAGGEQQSRMGNLKLVTTEGVVLAVWQQWRDSHILGDVLIFDSARTELAVEVILTSCICVVSAERANGWNWVGGLGK